MLLSICIGTYNRISVVLPTIEGLLRCPSMDFEIVVVDNVSTDGTFEALTALAKNDERLRVFQNDSNIGGLKNPVKALTLAEGKYCMELLDKDRIGPLFFPMFLDFLSNTELSHGYCTLNKNQTEQKRIFSFYESGFDSICNTAYLSKHPSGDFYRTALLKKCPIVPYIFSTNAIFGFYSELMSAECAVLSAYKSALYDAPLVFTEELGDGTEKPKSHTYSARTFFATPLNRAKEYSVYLKHSVSLGLLEAERERLLGIIANRYYKTLRSCKDLAKNAVVLRHYGISRTNIFLSSNLFMRCCAYILFSIHYIVSSKAVIPHVRTIFSSTLPKRIKFWMELKRLRIFCKSHTRLYIYGSGVVGKRIAAYFEKHRMQYAGFIVTLKTENISLIDNHPVFQLDEVTLDYGLGVVLGLNMKNREEVLSLLKKRKITADVFFSDVL